MIAPSQLHEQALRQAYDLAAIPFAQGVRADRPWAPQAFVPHSYLPSHALLDEGDRALCTQFAGLAMAELFIMLEDTILVPAIENLLATRGPTLSSALRHCLVDLIDEERKHSEMFWRLLEAARPDWYARREFRIQPGGRQWGIDILTRYPNTFLAWIWLALLFEELTINIYRQYHSDPSVDPLFREVHRFHMLDETRHFHIEHHLLQTLWDPAPLAVRRLNARLFGVMMGYFVSPKTPLQSLEWLYQRSPHLKRHAAQFEREILSLPQNMAYQQAFYSRDALPMTFRCFDSYPEMALLQTIIPAYRPGPMSD